MSNEVNELYFLWTNDALNHVVVNLVILKIRHVLVRSDEDLVAQLSLQVYAKSLDPVSHRVAGLNTWKVLQELWIYSHVWRLLVQIVLVTCVVVILRVGAIVVAEAGLRLTHPVAAHLRAVLAARGLDHLLLGKLPFDVLIVLVLALHVLSVLV